MSAPLPLGPGVRILVEHATGLLALEKPAGIAAHPNTPAASPRALLHADYDETAECYRFPDAAGGMARVWLLNRLDSPTSGVILVAVNEPTARAVRALFAEREVEKTYHAVVKGGRLVPPAGIWKDRLEKHAGGDHVRAAASKSGVEAVSEYAWMKTNRELPALSLIRLTPHTGRTHQLRIQCAAHGHPIVGDKTYGDFALNKQLGSREKRFDRLFLHCSRTAFSFVLAGKTHAFAAESPLPPEFDLITGGRAPTAVSDRLAIRIHPPKKR